MPGRITTAMVLSAGLGTRMAQGDDGLPKPLVRLNGKALIDHVLDRHAEAGIERVVVNVHHKADMIEKHLRGRRTPLIEISDERAKLLERGARLRSSFPTSVPCFWIRAVA